MYVNLLNVFTNPLCAVDMRGFDDGIHHHIFIIKMVVWLGAVLSHWSAGVLKFLYVLPRREAALCLALRARLPTSNWSLIQGSYSCVIVDSWTLVAGLATAISAVVNPILDHRWEIISTGWGRHSCGVDT